MWKTINEFYFYILLPILLSTALLPSVVKWKCSLVYVGMESGVIIGREAVVDETIDQLSFADEGGPKDA